MTGNDNDKIEKAKKFNVGILLLLLIPVAFTFIIETGPHIAAEAQNSSPLPAQLYDGGAKFVSIQNDERVEAYFKWLENRKWLEGAASQTGEPDKSSLVIIDVGHGGEDPGCSAGEYQEKDLNLQIALKTEDELKKMGYSVKLLRYADSYIDKYERADMANKIGGAALVSIHQNSFTNPNVSGTETWYGGTNESSKLLAESVHKKILSATGCTDRGFDYDQNLVILNYTEMPSCLVEIGFMSNPSELERLASDEFQTAAAKSIAEGIDLFLKPRVMYLTFDDGPSKYTEAILDILKEKDIKATFFVISENVRKYPELALRIVNEGHTIGIHCQSHDYNKIYASAESYLSDFYEAQETVYEITGQRPSLFRFPGGSINNFNKKTYKAIIDEMTKLGFTYFDWNAQLGDSVNNAEYEKIIENAKTSAEGKARVVMLAHDSKSVTAEALGEIIDLFPDYLMEPITPATKSVQFKIP